MMTRPLELCDPGWDTVFQKAWSSHMKSGEDTTCPMSACSEGFCISMVPRGPSTDRTTTPITKELRKERDKREEWRCL